MAQYHAHSHVKCESAWGSNLGPILTEAPSFPVSPIMAEREESMEGYKVTFKYREVWSFMCSRSRGEFGTG